MTTVRLPSHSKYGAKRTSGPNGRVYASAREAKHAWGLRALQDAGFISGLTEQPRFTLLPAYGDYRPLEYVADFAYWEPSEATENMLSLMSRA